MGAEVVVGIEFMTNCPPTVSAFGLFNSMPKGLVSDGGCLQCHVGCRNLYKGLTRPGVREPQLTPASRRHSLCPGRVALGWWTGSCLARCPALRRASDQERLILNESRSEL